MAQVKKTDRNPKDCGQPYGENIPQKKRGLDFWYPRIMTIALLLNLLLQILILAFRWYRL